MTRQQHRQVGEDMVKDPEETQAPALMTRGLTALLLLLLRVEAAAERASVTALRARVLPIAPLGEEQQRMQQRCGSVAVVVEA